MFSPHTPGLYKSFNRFQCVVLDWVSGYTGGVMYRPRPDTSREEVGPPDPEEGRSPTTRW